MGISRVKLAIIDHVGSKAGLNYYTDALAEHLSLEGIDINVYSNYTNERNDIKYYNFFPRFINSRIFSSVKILIAFLKSAIFSKVNGADYVILHLFSSQAYFIFFTALIKLLGSKIIVISHDPESLADDDSEVFKKILYNQIADYIIVHNDPSFQAVSKYCSRKAKIHVIKHGGYFETEKRVISRENARKRLSIEDDCTLILFFGQIKKVKRLDILIKSLDGLTGNFKLVIAGKPWKSNFEEYQEMLDERELNGKVIKFIEFIEEERKEILFKACDIVVLPYERVFQSGVLLMAMSYGKTVLCSNIESFREIIIPDQNGVLFEKNNFVDCQKKLQNLIGDPSLRDTLAKNAFKCIEEDYSWGSIAKKYKKLLA